jgi:hypothetical protein
MAQFEPTVNSGREIAEISRDFAKPIEVLREAIHNSHDAGAKEVRVLARIEKLAGGSRGLTLEIADDGCGMTEDVIKNLFGLGHSQKETLPDRIPIGYKGHGTKIYYQASEVFVMTRRNGGDLLMAHLASARKDIFQEVVPKPTLLKGNEAQRLADERGLVLLRSDQGTIIRLVDFTPNSDRLIDDFARAPVVNYLRWFTIFGSFKKVLYPDYQPPMKLFFQGTNEQAFQEVAFGHDWPPSDHVDIKTLKKRDERRPFNYFCKTFRHTDIPVQSGYRIDIAALFEGSRGRRERDLGIRRQRVGGLYHEEERYGIWLCKDFIPIEPKFEWLNEEDYPLTEDSLQRPLILVNCQEFELTANRGSVGNSPDVLLKAVKDAVFKLMRENIEDDKDLSNFLNEYQQDLFSRLREKDRKALQRRIDRYNKKQRCTIVLPGGKSHAFFEPTREITLFGLISELKILDHKLLGLDILDYDDHVGIDLLVRRDTNPLHLLDKSKVAYTELKFDLESAINHPFDNLHSIICWETALSDRDPVQDPTGESFIYQEARDNDGITHAHLAPHPSSKLSHSIKVITLRRLLQERYGLQSEPNSNPIGAATGPTSGGRGKKPGAKR